MLEYILNVSTIWVLGLLMFDIFLRRETFHTYNRAYLISVLLSGIFIPLWSWDSNAVIYSSGITEPLAKQATDIKAGITTASTSILLSWTDWLWLIYIGGAAIALGKIIFEAIQVTRLINNGHKKTINGKRIISLRKAISPFSLFGYIFIYNADNYENHELKMILAHEEKHGQQYHTIDLIIIKIAQIVFWFHPLVYMIEYRLRMVHEYQADDIGKKDSKTYGKFLVEQSVLRAAPALSHSFIRSPLKKRIMMLTKKTSKAAKSKQLFIIPFVFIAMICCTQTAFSDDGPQREGNKVTYRGNVIEFATEGTADTLWVEDPVTGDLAMAVSHRDPMPIKLNGVRIYNEFDFTPGAWDQSKGTPANSNLSIHILKVYLLSSMNKLIKQLDDGRYFFRLSHVVLNKEGKIIYYNLSKLQCVTTQDERAVEVNEKLSEKFADAVKTIIENSPKYQPARYDGKHVPCLVKGGEGTLSFSVKDGKLSSI